ncbi:MAG: EAL domain-containing protein [Halothiobacillaceae bacterium]|nr:EAL domain-containing protein [Halothiobacillaceae bacterium]
MEGTSDAQGSSAEAPLEQARQRIMDLELLEALYAQALEEAHGHQEELRTRCESLQQGQASLAEQVRRFRELFEFAPMAYLVLDASGAIIEANFAACQMLGASGRSRLMRRPLRLYLPQAERMAFDALIAQALETGAPSSLDSCFEGRNGAKALVQINLLADTDEGGKPLYRVAALDVTGRHESDEQRRLAATVFEESSDGVMITDPVGRIQRVNRAFTQVTGYSESEVRGRKAALLASGRQDKAFYQAMWAQIGREGSWQGEVWNRRKNGEIYPEWLKIRTVFSADGRVLHRVGTFSDISDARGLHGEFDRYAFYDMLTELPNRTLFGERLKHALVRAHRDQSPVALLFLDLDRFKWVNDTLGHQTGDLLLQDVASRLRSVVRANDTVARLGGDEFTVILSDLGRDEVAHDNAARIAGKVCTALARPFMIGGHEIVIGCSLGIAMHPEDGETQAELVKHGDIAMYEAKRQGGGRAVFFSSGMNARVARRVQLGTELRHALRHDQLALVYQPVIDVAAQRVAGVEALLRWGAEGVEPVGPEELVSIFEEIGLGDELARWVLRRACDELLSVGFFTLPQRWCSINVSPSQLARNHIGWVTKILEAVGLPPRSIVLEVTEEHFKCGTETISDILGRLRAQGVRVALDDFGLGYSSLAQLRHLPIDMIKIDRGFIRSLPDEPQDLAIVEAVLILARRLGLDFLAEGVETAGQLDELVRHGCPLVQGHVFAEPMPVQACRDWIDSFCSTQHPVSAS